MKLYRPILSLSFAFLVLFSSSSFVIGIHFCGGEVQNMALFSKAEGCEKEQQLPPCHRHELPPCCQDETILHDAQGFNSDQAQIGVSPLAPAFDAVQPPVLLAEVTPAISPALHYNYDPPIQRPDLTVTLQVFLI